MSKNFVPAISEPCDRDWNSMRGDGCRRFCAHCQLHVHNLSAMTKEEQRLLLGNRQERVCVAYVADSNTVPVRPGLWMLIQRLRRLFRFVAVCCAILSSTLLSNCSTVPPRCDTPEPPPEPQATKRVQNLPDGKMIAGGITFQPPFWQRVLFFWRR